MAEGTQSIAFQDYPKEPITLERIPIQFMKQACFVPVACDDSHLTVAMADCEDYEVLDALRLTYNLEIIAFQGLAEDIYAIIDRNYGSGSQSIEDIIEEAGKDVYNIQVDGGEDVDHLKDMASEAPIIRLVNRLIVGAVEMRASDIHFEPFDDHFQVRYRIDGVLHPAETPPKRLQPAVISRIKIMAKLDIAERRLPQDGSVKLKISDRQIDFRVSTIPTIYGESLVMRILDRESLVLSLKEIGFPDDIYNQYLRLIKQPYGMILVTGPTGSGKTSTLYTTLSMINAAENKVVTLEDPVEYQLVGINQIQVNSKIGMNFARGLRSIVRQDPDIILVGEIRDGETAEIAIQSALTGHLIFSTLHTNDSAGAVTRLLDMGVEHFLLSSTLLGILAQRLVRVICPECKATVNPDPKLIKLMNLNADEMSNVQFFEGKGCEACHHTGFSGRTAIFEFLPVNDEIRSEIAKQSDTDRIKSVARKMGLRTLREDGWKKVMDGTTTLAEVLRVTLEV